MLNLLLFYNRAHKLVGSCNSRNPWGFFGFFLHSDDNAGVCTSSDVKCKMIGNNTCKNQHNIWDLNWISQNNERYAVTLTSPQRSKAMKKWFVMREEISS